VTENSREERKTSSQTAVEITILRSKKELRCYRGTGEEFTDTISAYLLTYSMEQGPS
jgi:hypothetical protein